MQSIPVEGYSIADIWLVFFIINVYDNKKIYTKPSKKYFTIFCLLTIIDETINFYEHLQTRKQNCIV